MLTKTPEDFMMDYGIPAIEKKNNIRIHKGEAFKQAYYNGKISDSVSLVEDKIALMIKHYPGQNLIISIYPSDESSQRPFAYVVVFPA